VNNDCTLHNSIVLAICAPKIIQFGGDLTKFWHYKLEHFWHTL